MSDQNPADPDLAAAAEALQAGRLDEAERCFERACTGSSPAEGFNGRGTVSAARRDFGAAAQHFQRAADLDPNNALYRYQLGVSMLGTGRLEAATAAFEKAVELDSGFGQAWFNLGSARRQAGNGDGAIAAFRKASEGSRGVEQARLAVVDTFRAAGAVDPAIAAAREASPIARTGRRRGRSWGSASPRSRTSRPPSPAGSGRSNSNRSSSTHASTSASPTACWGVSTRRRRHIEPCSSPHPGTSSRRSTSPVS